MNDKCSKCTGIDKNPSHYKGNQVTPEEIVKCILYEAFTLGITILTWTTTKWQDKLIYDIDAVKFTPSEILKSIALVKIRLLYDFLYNSYSEDDFKMCSDFSTFGIKKQYDPKKLVGFQPNKMFSKKSINKFIVHLTNQRITKPECIPQPKFLGGDKATINNSKIILNDISKFVKTVMNHKSFGKLDPMGNAYLKGFRTLLMFQFNKVRTGTINF